ncbi:MAG: glucose-6-phosphate dehydrogenase [Actinomycetota bacterium]
MSGKLDRPEPQDIVVFGASGDLAQRKLLPALHHLFVEGLLPEPCAIVGFSRTEMADQEFAARARDAVERSGNEKWERWEEFAASLSYVSGAVEGSGSLRGLREHLEHLDATRGTDGRRFYYCATPPETFTKIVESIAAEDLGGNARIVIEKPFGIDLESARALNRDLHRVFDESRVFRIDHYLGKETVQNILVLRFANALLEPLWNRKYVDHVELTVAEEIGIEGRGKFYERTGALREMVQTHLFQVLSFLTMEPPPVLEPEALRDETVKVLRSMRVCRPENLVLGQYRGYRDEDDVASDSEVDTFAALRLDIDSWRWAGVPFFLRTGKRLPRKVSEATVVFRPAPLPLFEHEGVKELGANRLTIRIQPDEGISISFHVQRPGIGISLDHASLDFDYGEEFAGTPLVEAYEQLLYEAMRGDHTLFLRQDGVERAWEVLTPVFEDQPPVISYEPGSWGPAEADALIAPQGWWTT